MDPIATIQGLATGIDFRDLVGQIIEAESRPTLIMARRRAEIDQRTAAWLDFESRVGGLDAQASALARGDSFEAFTATLSGDSSALTATATSSAVPGSYAMEVLQVATREKIGSDAWTDRTQALGLSGEFVVGGRAVSVSATATLDDVAVAINDVNRGANASGVSASVIGSQDTGYRIVLTAATTGADGVGLADGGDGVLRSLGFIDGSVSIKHQTSNGARGDEFRSAQMDVATLLGLSSPPAAAAVTIGGVSVSIDLASDSLDDIAAAINTAASGAGSNVTASVIETADGMHQLQIDDTTAFTDASGILETLGVVEAGRSSIAQQIGGGTFTDGDGVTAATGGTLLTDVWSGGASAGVQSGDTLTLNGTRGDGTTFTKTFNVTGTSTLQDLADALNDGVDGYGAGARTATASIVGGALTVTDGTAGTSRLALSIVSHNEGGGTLDFGTIGVTTEGRNREITRGLDAEVLVDGVFFSRSTNVMNDVIEGVTLTASDVTEGPVVLDVTQDVGKIADSISAFIKAFNSISEFVADQFSGAGADGGSKRPLSGNSTLRIVRNQMRDALESTIASSVSDFSRLSELGIEINQSGTYDVDMTKLRSVIEADPAGVERVFSAFGTSESSDLRYLYAGSDVPAGSYAVSITAPATRASVLGTGFGGTYVDDGTADTLTITDSDTGAVYDVSLTNGMTMTQIVDALNAEFAVATRRELEATNAIKSDGIGTDATETTTLDGLFDAGGVNLGVANGDIFTISGTGPGGASYFREFTVTDASTQTLGDLRSEIQNAIGLDVVVDVRNGRLTATALETGSGDFTLSVQSNNQGGGTFNVGGISPTEAGRSAGRITASDVGGQLEITHDDYGTNLGFDVAFTAGGTDGSASLGVPAGSYAGTDVAGTIGGFAATGSGRVLTGDEGTEVEGLGVEFLGTAAGAPGTVTFSRGISSLVESITDSLLDGGDGSIQGIRDRLDTQGKAIDDRIEAFEERMKIRSDALIRRFSRLEEAMAEAQQQASWLQAQLGSLLPTQSAG